MKDGRGHVGSGENIDIPNVVSVELLDDGSVDAIQSSVVARLVPLLPSCVSFLHRGIIEQGALFFWGPWNGLSALVFDDVVARK